MGGSVAQPLMLRVLCWLSILNVAILSLFLLVLLFFLLLTNQKLLWRPAKLPALDFSFCGLNHDGWEAIFELTAALKI